VPGVLVTDPPVVGPEGVVYGIGTREELAVGTFTYDVEMPRIRTLPRPDGWKDSTSPWVPRGVPRGET
jgi:hypothetical protein